VKGAVTGALQPIIDIPTSTRPVAYVVEIPFSGVRRRHQILNLRDNHQFLESRKIAAVIGGKEVIN
jgi:hypothetical protein